MRWFTREWAWGGLDDARYTQAMADHREHRAEVLPRLPPAFAILLGEPDASGHRHTLHDARVVSWAVDLPRRFELQLICWGPAAADEPEGLEIVYGEGVELIGPDEQTLAAWFSNPETTFVYEEADALPDRRFEHRHLLEPDGEFGVRFGDIKLAFSPASPEDYHALRGRTR
jgi:hypothetical protein